MIDEPMCSIRWEQADLPAWGTAATARFWLAVEVPGSWGRSAVAESALDPDLGKQLEARVKAAGGQLVLIRRPGRTRRVGRTVLLGGPDFLLGTDIDDYADLAALPPEDLAAAPGFTPRDPVMLVCTNGKRDVCCSVRGREVVAAAAQQRPDTVWESSHLHGHRLAPTGVLLPGGLVLGRLTGDLVVDAVDAARDGRLPESVLGPRHYRGMSALTKEAQVAEACAREHWGAVVARPLSVEDVAGMYRVTGPEGQTLTVRVGREAAGEFAVSCGKPAEPQSIYTADIVA